MGEPNFPCFKQSSPFAQWSTVTTTSTTTGEPDYFIIPPSGGACKYKLVEANFKVIDND